MTDQINNTTYRLEGVVVDTVGLVSAGANNKKIFLTKSEEDNMEENVVTTPVVPEVDEVALLDAARETAKETSTGLFKSLFKGFFPSEEEEEEVEVEVADVVIPESLRKQIDDMAAEQAQLKADLAKANEKLALAEANTDEREFLAKAQEYKSVSVNTSELAKFMSFVSKADGDQFEWFDNFVKGVNAQLADAGIYSEFGKLGAVEQSDDPIANMIKSGEVENERDALLGMNEKDAYAFIEKRRKELRG